MIICSGFQSPEFMKHQVISSRYDIYSLGVIIVWIMIGSDDYYSNISDMTRHKFVKQVR